MDLLLNWLQLAGEACLQLFMWPFTYIALAVVWYHSKQSVNLQRQLYHVRMRGSLSLTVSKTLAGIAAGVLLSLFGFATGANLTTSTLVCVWGATFVLALFRLRYVCLAYAAGVLGIIQAVLSWIGTEDYTGTSAKALEALRDIDVPALLFLAGLLHLAEAVLIRLQGARQATPLFLEGKRGKPIGAYSLSSVWPIPLLWLVPAAGGAAGLTLPWTPLFGLDGAGAAGWTLAAFPVLIGFGDRTETRWPEDKARELSGGLILYGLIIIALAVGAVYWHPLTVIAGLAAFGLHEGLLIRSRHSEQGRQPVYVQNGRGVTILAVLPGTPAAEMKLVAGEVLVKVNGAKVRNKEQLHAALQIQSAFCRLEVLNREGHLKFVQRARYAGEHYQLGLILAPDEDADYVAAPRSASLWQGLRLSGARLRSGGRRELARTAAEEMAAAAEVTAAEEERAELEAPPEPPKDPGLPPRREKH